MNVIDEKQPADQILMVPDKTHSIDSDKHNIINESEMSINPKKK